MENKISVRGRMARKMVELANHLSPVAEQGSKNELREKLFAKDWKCPVHLQLIGIEMENFYMELLREQKQELLYIPNPKGIFFSFTVAAIIWI